MKSRVFQTDYWKWEWRWAFAASY